MLKQTVNSILIASLMIFAYGCSNNSTGPEAVDELEQQPLFLLGLDGDPADLEDYSPGINGGPRGRRPGGAAFAMGAIGNLLEALDLTAEQQEQIDVILANFRDTFKDLRDQWQSGASWDEVRAARKALRDQLLEEIRAVLTAEQVEVLDAMLEELKNRRMPEEMIARRVAHLTEILALTEEQQQQITAFLTEASTKLMTAREESGSREEFREAAVAIFQELDQQISSVLTAEQLELYNELKEQRRNRRGGPFGRSPRN